MVVDVSRCSEPEFLQRFASAESIVRRRFHPYCILWDISGTTVTRTITDAAKSLALFTAAQGLSTGSATVGVVGIKRLIARAIKPDMYWANDVDDAVNWLTNSERWRPRFEPLAASH